MDMVVVAIVKMIGEIQEILPFFSAPQVKKTRRTMSKTPRVLVINLNQERLDALNWATCAQASKKTTGKSPPCFERRPGITYQDASRDPALSWILRKKWKRFPKNPHRHRTQLAIFAAHVRVWEEIVRKRMNHVIVCEDDAFLRGALPTIRELESSRYGATPLLLGGGLAHPTSWAADAQWQIDHVPRFRFRDGVNHISRSKARWVCNCAIYYPRWTQVAAMLQWFKAYDGTFKHMDLMLNHIVRHLYYPSVFDHDDRGLNANNIYFTRCVLRDYRRWDPGYGTTPYAKITAGGGYPIRRPPPKRRGRPRASLGAASE